MEVCLRAGDLGTAFSEVVEGMEVRFGISMCGVCRV